MSDQRDDEAIRLLRQRDARGFELAYQAYGSRVFAFLLRLSRRKDLAEDLLQHTFLRLAERGSTLRPGSDLRAWLFTVARNRYLSHARSGRLTDDDSALDAVPDPGVDQEAPHRSVIVRRRRCTTSAADGTLRRGALLPCQNRLVRSGFPVRRRCATLDRRSRSCHARCGVVTWCALVAARDVARRLAALPAQEHTASIERRFHAMGLRVSCGEHVEEVDELRSLAWSGLAGSFALRCCSSCINPAVNRLICCLTSRQQGICTLS